MNITYENYKGGINNLIVVSSNNIITTGQRSKEQVINNHIKKLNQKIETLKTRISSLQDKKYDQQCDEHRKLDNMGWGSGMRGYHCMRRTFKSQNTQDKINEVEKQLKEIQTEIENYN